MVSLGFFAVLLIIVSIVMTIINLAKGKPDLGWAMLILAFAMLMEFWYVGWPKR